MKSVQGIDPIVVREAAQRLDKAQRIAEAGRSAAAAVTWFKEYADRPEVFDVIRISATLVASSTPNAADAQAYVVASAARFAQQILDDAILHAEATLYRSDDALRGRRADEG